tara:strand:- start:345 stop:1139 length:795 start_codon:yes stop_codon:yes gene_type:complete
MIQIYTLNKNKFLDKKGFTLLELLISVSLLGLLITIIYGSFFQITTLSKLVKSDISLREELRLIMKIAINDLQNIKFLKNFPESEIEMFSKRETGIIAERIIGSKNNEKRKINEYSLINFHSATKSLFYPEKKAFDPEIHEIGYSIKEDPQSKKLSFLRREDFYIDKNIKEGGKIQIISQSVEKFDVELLESETELAGGGYKENWTKQWNSNENICKNENIEGNFCLPRAVKLSIALKGKDENIVSDSQVVNLCIPPCNSEIFK